MNFELHPDATVNKRAVFQTLGTLLLVLAGMFLFPLFVALIGHGTNPPLDEVAAFLKAIGITAAAGALLHLAFRSHRSELGPGEGFAIVTLGWSVFAAFGALPFFLAGTGLSYTDCFFETLSGLTTTGASILTATASLPRGIESMPAGLGFWRCMTQWLGGMGIVLLTVAVLPVLGKGGYQLFRAEVPGPTKDQLTPRIRQTAVTLWKVYALLTIAETVLLMVSSRIGGAPGEALDIYDALCHTFTTLSTGGFSTKNTSIVLMPALTQWVFMLFMFLAGVNFVLHYRVMFGRELTAHFKSEELRWYIAMVAILAALIFCSIYGGWFLDDYSPAGARAGRSYDGIEKTARVSLFNSLTIITTTGYVNADYDVWSPMARFLIFLGMFLGGCAGSTAGGMKTVRVLVIFKYAWREIKQLFMPRAVLPVRFEQKPVEKPIVASIAAFFVLWMLIVAMATIALMALIPGWKGAPLTPNGQFLTALSSVVSMLGNIGPGLSGVGPYMNYAHIPDAGKWLLTLLMLLGRLEIYSVLILLLPHTWRK